MNEYDTRLMPEDEARLYVEIGKLRADLAAARAELDAVRNVIDVEGFEGTLAEQVGACNSQRTHALMEITELSGDMQAARAALEAAQNTIRDLEQRIQFWSAGREVKDTFLAQNPEETR